MHAQKQQESFKPAPLSIPTRPRKGRLVAVPSLEQRLCDTLTEYSEDFPQDAFPSFLESRYFEELCGTEHRDRRKT